MPWETDVKAGLYWLQAALNPPLKPGSRVLVGSSGAAVNGSPMSGGYAGAKRMLWIMAKYANGVSAEKGLGIYFQAIVPLQIIGGTGVGDAGANAYASAMGMKPEQFDRFVRRCRPGVRREVVSILDDPKYADGIAFGLKGDTGITVLEGGAAEPILATQRAVNAAPAQFLALVEKLRPELHRYCARLMGSVIDGEDVVQDTFVRAFVALDELDESTPMRAWLFRIAHNRALDVLRSRAIRPAEPIEAAQEVADPQIPDPVEVMMRREAVETAVSRFAELPTMQRSVVSSRTCSTSRWKKSPPCSISRSMR